MDLYVILGLAREATPGDIKRAYRRLARKYHPDINPGDRLAEAQFRQIAEAYETLIDPDRRRRYDSLGRRIEDSQEPTIGFEGFDFSVSVGGAAAPTFGDLFADVLQRDPQAQSARRDAPQRGADLHQSINCSFDDAMRGGQRQLAVTRQEHCRGCGGTGRVRTAESRCLHCQGAGVVKSARGHMVFSKTCLPCGGSGRLTHTRCPACGGLQTERRTESLTIQMPAGLADGARIRVPAKGHAGPNGGEPGDLYITVHVQAHPRFTRQGDDLYLVLPIAIHEAALGARLEVPTLEGTARLRVPPGTQSGQRFRLRERGAPSPRDGRRGDLVVEVRLALPRVLDERSKELLREFGRINSGDIRQEIDK